MQLYINGEIKEIPLRMNLIGLLEHFSLPSERIAIELNEKVVRRKDWTSTEIKEGDRLEVIHFVGGG